MRDRDESNIRLVMVGVVCLSLFASLTARLWYLQVIGPEEFRVEASTIHIRVIHEEGTRGRILDRNGRVIVDNKVTIWANLDRQQMLELDADARSEMFDRLASTLTDFGIPTKAPYIEDRYDDQRWGPHELVPIAELPGQDVELYLAEHHEEFPGVVVRRKSVRTYPYGGLAAHIVGYVGQINERELEARQRIDGEPSTDRPVGTDEKPYETGDEIGKAGVEATFEGDLRGVPADRRIEVDARNHFVRTIDEASSRPGDDIWLTIDIELQAYAEQQLQLWMESVRGSYTSDDRERKTPQGSLVITNPGTGEILAMASNPSYDPSLLVNGIDSALWERLNDPAAGQPLFNWALQGQYAPGSTFKLMTATAGLQTGFLHEGNDIIQDPGYYTVQGCDGGKCTFQNAGRVPYGTVDLTKSITVSSDVYYYWLGEGLWLGRDQFGDTAIQDAAAKFGLGTKTGVALPGEAAGRLPTPEWVASVHEANPEAFPRGTWRTGDNLNTAIGQGDVLVTPLQLANAYGTFANGGTQLTPLIVNKVTRPIDVGGDPTDPENYEIVRAARPIPVDTIDLDPEQYTRVLEGLQGVVQQPGGTAYREGRKYPSAWPTAGKTGTAQVSGKADTSVFAAFGPTGGEHVPQYAAAAIVPEAGFGSDLSAPLVLSVLRSLSEGSVPALAVPEQAVEVVPPEAPLFPADSGAGE